MPRENQDEYVFLVASVFDSRSSFAATALDQRTCYSCTCCTTLNAMKDHKYPYLVTNLLYGDKWRPILVKILTLSYRVLAIEGGQTIQHSSGDSRNRSVNLLFFLQVHRVTYKTIETESSFFQLERFFFFFKSALQFIRFQLFYNLFFCFVLFWILISSRNFLFFHVTYTGTETNSRWRTIWRAHKYLVRPHTVRYHFLFTTIFFPSTLPDAPPKSFINNFFWRRDKWSDG